MKEKISATYPFSRSVRAGLQHPERQGGLGGWNWNSHGNFRGDRLLAAWRGSSSIMSRFWRCFRGVLKSSL